MKEGYEAYREDIKSIMEYAFSDFKSYNVEEVEYLSRDGFWSFVNGGFTVKKFIPISTFVNSGFRFGSKEADDEIQRVSNNILQSVKDNFIDNHPEYKGKDFDYNSLYEEGKGALAEEYSNDEVESLSGSDVCLSYTVYFYNKDNRHSDKSKRDSILMKVAVNLDEYGREENEKYLEEKTVYAYKLGTSLRVMTQKALDIFESIPD